MRLLAILSLLAVATAHVEHIEKRSQPGAPQPVPVKLAPLVWGDVNVIATTDTHGYLSGSLKDASFSADFGDFSSFLHGMRRQALFRGKDLLVVDSGDIFDGSGLSDASKPQNALSNPIFEKINYDVLTVGNHELYVDSIAEDTYRNFAPNWKNYITSNVFIKDAHTNKTVPIGKLHSKFRMRFGTTVQTYSLLFNFKQNAQNVVVQNVNDTIQEPWFKKSLKDNVDMYLIVGHTAVRSAEALVMIKAIREAHPSKPILLFGGHYHTRDFVQYDARAFGLASGRFMETLGWMSVQGIRDRSCRVEANCIGKNLTVTRRYLDTNVHTYKTHSLAHPRQKFDTWKGRQISKEITEARKSLNLSNAFGCSPQNYYLNRYAHTDPRSVLHVVANQVLPVAVVDATRPYPGVVFVNSGSQRADVTKGPFTFDDTFIVSPFHNDFLYVSVPLRVAKQILDTLNKKPFQKRQDAAPAPPVANATLTPGYVTKDDFGYGGDDWPHSPIPFVPSPTYISSPLPTNVGDEALVDVIWLSYFTNLMVPIFAALDPSKTYTPATYRSDIDTNTMWPAFVKQKWNTGDC